MLLYLTNRWNTVHHLNILRVLNEEVILLVTKAMEFIPFILVSSVKYIIVKALYSSHLKSICS